MRIVGKDLKKQQQILALTSDRQRNVLLHKLLLFGASAWSFTPLIYSDAQVTTLDLSILE